jgi:rhodanese-related sulfurtransferase
MLKSCIAISALLVLVTLTPGAARAETGETPPTVDGAKVVSAQDVKMMVEKGALVFDARKKAAFSEGHIPGAKSVGSAFDKEAKTFDATVFGPDKTTPLVIHGHGSDGWTAVYGVKAAVASGYSNVNWFRGGWAEWQAAGFPVE